MITTQDFHRLRATLGEVAEADIVWANQCKPPEYADEFALEAIFVICNSGMKNTVALGIFKRCVGALAHGEPVLGVFKHVGKAAAIEAIWQQRRGHLQAYLAQPSNVERLAYLRGLPWIGEITCYHLAKNFGMQVAKPDRHLQRLADREGTTPQALCERLAAELGLCVNAVDTVLWRACASGVLNSRTGEIA